VSNAIDKSPTHASIHARPMARISANAPKSVLLTIAAKPDGSAAQTMSVSRQSPRFATLLGVPSSAAMNGLAAAGVRSRVLPSRSS
jgi:hypothetical protein